MAFAPAVSHFPQEVSISQVKEPGHHRPMGALENRAAKFPIGNRAAVHSQVLGKLLLALAHLSALLPKPLGNRLAVRQRVVAEKIDDAVQRGRVRGLELAAFPVDDGKLGDFHIGNSRPIVGRSRHALAVKRATVARKCARALPAERSAVSISMYRKSRPAGVVR